MYTIKWVAEHLGLAPGTLRAWEQRYGVVTPTRSQGGYRLYDDDDVEALRTMARLVSEGLQAGRAAAQVRSARRLAPNPSRAGTDPQSSSGLPDPGALVAASRSYDLRGLEDVLDAAFAAARFEHVVDSWLMVAMAEVGGAWAAGELDVSQEHFATAGVMRRLAAAFDAAGDARAGRHVVVGLTPGATHEIATLAFATMLRRAGLRVTYLGADLPVDSWVEAVHTIRPDAVVLGAPRLADATAADDVVRALDRECPGLPVHVGGPGAAPAHRLEAPSLSAACARLAESLR